jgi:hypothetical protein
MRLIFLLLSIVLWIVIDVDSRQSKLSCRVREECSICLCSLLQAAVIGAAGEPHTIVARVTVLGVIAHVMTNVWILSLVSYVESLV